MSDMYMDAHMMRRGDHDERGVVRPPNFDHQSRKVVHFDERLHETGKAVKFRLGEAEFWFPLSCIDFQREHDNGTYTVEVPAEMFHEKCREQNVNKYGYPRAPKPGVVEHKTDIMKTPQVQNTPKESTMKTSMLVALMTEGFSLVGVRFRQDDGSHSRKLYHYKYPSTDIEAGDMAVVESPHNGFVIVDVETVDTDPVLDVDASYSYKWIVQKVDTTEYYQHRDRELALTKHLKRLKNKAVAEQTLDTIRKELEGTAASGEFEELVSQLNVDFAKKLQDNPQPTTPPYREDRILGVTFQFWINYDRWSFRRVGDAAVHKGFASYRQAADTAERMVKGGVFK